MKRKYKITIIIPIYNVEKYIRNCLNSVIKQTLKDIQVIIVNDGSTDNSGEIAGKIAKKHDNLIITHKKNGGLGDARNQGLKFSEGEYILFLDGDDMLPPNACEILYKKAKVLNSDILIGKPVWRYKNGVTKQVKYLMRWFKRSSKINYRYNESITIGFPTATSKLFRASLIKDNNIKFPNVTGEDVVFSVYSFHKSKRIHIIPNIVYWRTERKDPLNLSITQQKNLDIVSDRIEVIRLIDKYCDENKLDFIKRYNRKGTFRYILNVIKGLKSKEEKKEAYKLLKEFIDNNFTNNDEIRNYISLTYNDIVKRASDI